LKGIKYHFFKTLDKIVFKRFNIIYQEQHTKKMTTLTKTTTTSEFATLWDKQIPIIEKHWATSAGFSTYKSYNLAEDPVTSYEYDVEITKSAPVTVFVGLNAEGVMCSDFTEELMKSCGIVEYFPEEVNALDSEDSIWEQLEKSYFYQKTRKDFAEKAKSLQKELPEGDWEFNDYYSFNRLDLWNVVLKYEYYPAVELDEGFTVPPTVIQLAIRRGGSLDGFLSLTTETIASAMSWEIKDRQAEADRKYNSVLADYTAQVAERKIRDLRKAGKPIPKHLR
jgi:hypothetical protein